MSKILELRQKRSDIWDKAKAFLDDKRGEDGLISAEDTASYEKMEQDVVDLGKEIDRLERADALDREMSRPTNAPLTSKPQVLEDEKEGRASSAYNDAFWRYTRNRIMTSDVRNALETGTDTEGGYLVPDEFEKMLVESLLDENIFRKLAHTITTSHGDRKIPIVASRGSATWVEEEGAIPESDNAFGQMTLNAYKLATLVKISEELLQDSAFNMPAYLAKEIARRLAVAEEEAFLVGDGTGKPTGLLHTTGGAEIGVTAASATAITADEIIDLFYSLRAPYRKRASWMLNDTTVKTIRKLKDSNGQYLWQPALTANSPDMLLGRPLITSVCVPSIAADAKIALFGDYSYYWIADRKARSLRRLNELFSTTGQVGFLATQRVDGKITLPEAVKVLQMKA